MGDGVHRGNGLPHAAALAPTAEPPGAGNVRFRAGRCASEQRPRLAPGGDAAREEDEAGGAVALPLPPA